MNYRVRILTQASVTPSLDPHTPGFLPIHCQTTSLHHSQPPAKPEGVRDQGRIEQLYVELHKAPYTTKLLKHAVCPVKGSQGYLANVENSSEST